MGSGVVQNTNTMTTIENCTVENNSKQRLLCPCSVGGVGGRSHGLSSAGAAGLTWRATHLQHSLSRPPAIHTISQATLFILKKISFHSPRSVLMIHNSQVCLIIERFINHLLFIWYPGKQIWYTGSLPGTRHQVPGNLRQTDFSENENIAKYSRSFSYLESILLPMMDDEAFLDLPFMFPHHHTLPSLTWRILYWLLL